MSTFKFIKAKNRKTLLTTSSNKKSIEFEKSITKKPHAEYHETLYSDQMNIRRVPTDPLFLKDIPSIEKDIDVLHKTKSKTLDSDIEKKVDAILAHPPKIKKQRKPSNVIYVVSKPQPGQVKGDWAVRSHGKIFSHHRTKLAAIDKAREIARKREATVLVQNTDGTFSEGFRPRKK